MVTNVTSLTGNGLKDWLIQRVTSVYFGVYSLFVLGYLLLHPQLNYVEWHRLFHHMGFKIASLLALFALSLHAWVGVWTITTDYIKGVAARLAVQMLVVLWLLVQFVWGLMILWGQ
ncbi:succinate dehydrogenase, hydrophobic membrane anchor protein [Legionella lansingensis]|uniref:Succinate dehydrogenase hydrophobic membrane anchor subunit n=1 Tax=Legionella lansingensis TaxID=45067 RepID=A0A0W0VPY6_9GAMM|nr:succinate dehydrogenase, hydrophobic membrane anchor protein [Legionella lansingensis]KTD22228.1 succinate dehydrogenase, hydrophobic membrane anchor protein [Legionella lansingensis]SNV55154.1 succinate dehydrogenase, hydrophobic membrane anchor protein [Legionella lansingensis]